MVETLDFLVCWIVRCDQSAVLC